MLQGFSKKTCEIQGKEIRYYQSGSTGPQILLLHGMMIDSAKISWSEVAPVLARTMQVTVVDLPGFGASEAPRGSVSIAYYSNFLKKFIETIGIPRLRLAGIGIGATIAADFALLNPQVVEHLYLLASGGYHDFKSIKKLQFFTTRMPGVSTFWMNLLGKNQKIFKTALRTMFFNHDNISDELVKTMVQEFKNRDNLQTYTALSKNEFSLEGRKTFLPEVIAQLKVPLTIIHGQYDLISPPVYVQEAIQSTPNTDFRIIPKCGHWITLDKPEIAAAFLRQ